MPRESRKRGGSAHIRGLSTEQVCVSCAIDRKGHSYSIQRINNYHSKLKKCTGIFNGVATKYLNNYLIWHIWFDIKGHTQLEKADLFLIKAIANAISVHFRQLSMRPTIPINV